MGCNAKKPCAKGFVCVNGGRCEQSCQVDMNCRKGKWILLSSWLLQIILSSSNRTILSYGPFVLPQSLQIKHGV